MDNIKKELIDLLYNATYQFQMSKLTDLRSNKSKNIHKSYVDKLTNLIVKNFPDVDIKMIVESAVERANFDKCDY
jgi:predicted dinucleotide-utilizing enzyme